MTRPAPATELRPATPGGHAPGPIFASGLAVLGAVGAIVTAGCSRPSGELQPGSYRATVETPDGREVPFELDVAREERGPVLYLINGDERVRVTDVTVKDGRLAAHMPGVRNELQARVRGPTLTGRFLLVHADGQTLPMPFRARLGETWRFVERPLNDNADFEGRWAVTLTHSGGSDARAVAEFRQRFGRITGTVTTPSEQGLRPALLAGDVHDEEVKLSRFDGGVVVLCEAQLDAAGRLVGELWSDRAGRRHFVAQRDPDATIVPVAAPVSPGSL